MTTKGSFQPRAFTKGINWKWLRTRRPQRSLSEDPESNASGSAFGSDDGGKKTFVRQFSKFSQVKCNACECVYQGWFITYVQKNMRENVTKYEIVKGVDADQSVEEVGHADHEAEAAVGEARGPERDVSCALSNRSPVEIFFGHLHCHLVFEEEMIDNLLCHFAIEEEMIISSD